MAAEGPGRAAETMASIPPPPAAPPPIVTRRRHRSLFPYVALLVGTVVVLGGLGLLYVDDLKWQHRASDLSRQNATLSEQLLNAQTTNSDLQQQVAKLQAEVQHPQLGIWNVAQPIKGVDWYLAGGVPDTFTYHLNATSNGPMTVSILTFEQFAAGIECIDNGGGTTHYCMHHSRIGTVKTWPDVTSVNYDFHLAEGCADYLVVFTSARAITVTPNVSVTYNPAQTFTGSCA